MKIKEFITKNQNPPAGCKPSHFTYIKDGVEKLGCRDGFRFEVSALQNKLNCEVKKEYVTEEEEKQFRSEL